MFYSLCAMFFALLCPGYRCRRSNCEYDDIQPMIESHPCFTVYTPYFCIVADGFSLVVNILIFNLGLNYALDL